MAKTVILVNGLPASGKSSLAADISKSSGIPMLSVDTVLEELVDSVNYRFPRNAAHALADETAWKLAALIEDAVIVESFWAPERDREGVRTGLGVAGAERIVELWCDAPLDEAVQRYEERDRHGIHEDDPNDVELWERTTPLEISRVVTVDTSDGAEKADADDLVRKLREALSPFAE